MARFVRPVNQGVKRFFNQSGHVVHRLEKPSTTKPYGCLSGRLANTGTLSESLLSSNRYSLALQEKIFYRTDGSYWDFSVIFKALWARPPSKLDDTS